jgi:hypothetical protein
LGFDGCQSGDCDANRNQREEQDAEHNTPETG